MKPSWADYLPAKYKCSVFLVWRVGTNSSASVNREPFTRWQGRTGDPSLLHTAELGSTLLLPLLTISTELRKPVRPPSASNGDYKISSELSILKRYIQKKRIKFCCCLILAIFSYIHHHPVQYELQKLMPSGSVIMKK